MNYDLGKKLVMGGFGAAVIVGLVQAFGKIPLLTWLDVLLYLTIAAGFALMWYTSGNILYLAVSATYILGYILGIVLSSLFPNSILIASALYFIAANLYLLVWAYKRFCDGDMAGAAIIGGIFVFNLAERVIVGTLLDRLGVITGLNAVTMLIIPVVVAAAKIYMAFTESEK